MIGCGKTEATKTVKTEKTPATDVKTEPKTK
jgi:hypothetical protein